MNDLLNIITTHFIPIAYIIIFFIFIIFYNLLTYLENKRKKKKIERYKISNIIKYVLYIVTNLTILIYLIQLYHTNINKDLAINNDSKYQLSPNVVKNIKNHFNEDYRYIDLIKGIGNKNEKHKDLLNMTWITFFFSFFLSFNIIGLINCIIYLKVNKNNSVVISKKT